jgi:hypothetical protein
MQKLFILIIALAILFSIFFGLSLDEGFEKIQKEGLKSIIMDIWEGKPEYEE